MQTICVSAAAQKGNCAQDQCDPIAAVVALGSVHAPHNGWLCSRPVGPCDPSCTHRTGSWREPVTTPWFCRYLDTLARLRKCHPGGARTQTELSRHSLMDFGLIYLLLDRGMQVGLDSADHAQMSLGDVR